MNQKTTRREFLSKAGNRSPGEPETLFEAMDVREGWHPLAWSALLRRRAA